MDISKTSHLPLKSGNFKTIEDLIKKQKKNIPYSKSEQLSEIINLINKLDKPLQQTLIKTWAELNLPLTEKHIKHILKFLNNNFMKHNTAEHKIIIKSYGCLLKLNLPPLPGLVKGISKNLNPQTSLTDIINRINNNDFNDLTINPRIPVHEINKKIKNYTDTIIQTISEIKNNPNSEVKDILNHLLGQQILNLSEKDINNNFIITLEIPVHSCQKNKYQALYLKIVKEENKKSQSKSEKDFKISLLIELPVIGLLITDIVISGSNISGKFLISSEKTGKLINSNFTYLQERLENMGYNIDKPKINIIDDNKKQDIAKKDKLSFIKKDIKKSKEYNHIDFKV